MIASLYALLVAVAAISAVVAIFGAMNDSNNRYPGWLLLVAGLAGLLALAILPAQARDIGQWENADPAIREWFKTLMRPDMPTMSCCGEADAYWADEIRVRNGKVYAVITDTRPDGPLGRPHIPPGTEVEVPPEKLKWDRSNPTGHNVLFVSTGLYAWCFVQGTGI